MQTLKGATQNALTEIINIKNIYTIKIYFCKNERLKSVTIIKVKNEDCCMALNTNSPT